MKYTKTALRELSAKYRSILLKCAFLNAAILMGISSVNAYTVTENVDLNTVFPNGIVDEVITSRDGAVATLTTDTIEITPATGKAVDAKFAGSKVVLGTKGVSDITLSSSDSNTVLALEKGQIDIFGKNVNISSQSTDWAAVHAGNNVLTEAEDGGVRATVNINADQIKITSAKFAIGAMSRGIVNIEGNTTITASSVISARGNADVNINTSEKNTVVLNGNIDFNYNKGTSDSLVNANINVVLSNNQSSWTGNTIVSWDDVKPTDLSKLEVTDAQITLKNGAVWNATKITNNDVATNGYYYTALNNLNSIGGIVNIEDAITVENLVANGLTVNGGEMNIAETMSVSGDLTLGSGASIVNNGTITFNNGSSLTTALNNTDALITGGSVEGQTSLVIDNGVESATLKLFDASQDGFTITNTLYDIVEDTTTGGLFNIEKKTTEAVTEELISSGVNETTADAMVAIVGSSSTGNAEADKALSEISSAIQSGDIAKADRAVSNLAPTTSQAVLGVAQDVNKMLSQVVGARTSVSMGRSAGDTFQESSLWAQGLYNHTKQDSTAASAGFSADTKGVAIGLDGKLNEKTLIGLGYGYSKTDADTLDKDIDVDGHNFFIYGEYQPSQWRFNALASYGLSKYEEKKPVMGSTFKAKYDVDAYALNLTALYDFENGISPEAGLRYILIDQENYNDGIQEVSSKNNDVLTAVLGLQYKTQIQTEKFVFDPKARIAATYDILSDNSEAVVSLIGGGSYQVDGKRLHRLGFEAGVGVDTSVDNWDFSLEYNASLRQDYQSHTGMLKATYNF